MEVDQGAEKRPMLQPAAPVPPDWMMGTLSRELKQVISEKNLLTVRTRKRVMEDMEATASEAEDAQMERLRAKAVQEVISRYVQVAFVLTYILPCVYCNGLTQVSHIFQRKVVLETLGDHRRVFHATS